MRMLAYDVDAIGKELHKVRKEEALEYLEAGVPVVCRIHQREFVELNTEADLKQCEYLKEEGIYEKTELYISWSRIRGNHGTSKKKSKKPVLQK